MSLVDIWVNCPDRTCAERIATAVINDRLAACANIFPQISSLYRWNGRVEQATEIPLLLKSRDDLFDALSARITALHPYDIPPIVAVPVAGVNKPYGDWVTAETR